MGTVSGYKAVDENLVSFEGPPELASLRQTYTIGTDVTPDPAAESAAKAAAGGHIAQMALGEFQGAPNGTNGVFVYVNEPGGDNRVLGWARRMARGHRPPGRVVRVTFDDADVVSIYGLGPTDLSGAPDQIRTYQVASVHVEEEIPGPGTP